MNKQPSASNQQQKEQVDQLLAGLNRLNSARVSPNKSSPEILLPSSSIPQKQSTQKVTTTVRKTETKKYQQTYRNEQPKLSSSSSQSRASSAYSYRRTPSLSKLTHPMQPLISVSKLDVLQVVEQALGLHTNEGLNFRVISKLVKWITAASINSPDVLQAVTSSCKLTDAFSNIQALAVVLFFFVTAGPVALPQALESENETQPNPAIRFCMNILSSVGHKSSPDILYDDERVRRMTIATGIQKKQIPLDCLQSCPPHMKSLTAAAMETYAIAVGRKFIFHSRHPDVEVNYSLDRFFRRLHIENRVDRIRQDDNNQILATIISRAAVEEMSLLVHALIVSTQRLLAVGCSTEVFLLILGESCNAFTYFSYLQMKTNSPVEDHFSVEGDITWLTQKVRAVRENAQDWKVFKKYVDPQVYRFIVGTDDKPNRPESKHRREIVCSFTSFNALHNSLESQIMKRPNLPPS